MTAGERLSNLDPRHNSIGFLRLAAALLVIVGHSFPYGGFGTDPLLLATNNQLAIGRFPVDVFFCLSGFLIAQSFTRSGGWGVYTWHRFLRIFPAFLTCLIITALVISPIFGSGIDPAYIFRNAPLITGIHDAIPGLFTNTPESPSVNSAMWTLPWELRAYLLIGLLGAFGLLRRKWLVVVLFAGAWAIFLYQIFAHPGLQTGPSVTSGFRLVTFFLCGTLFFLFRERIPMHWGLFVGSLALMTVSTLAGMMWLHYSSGLFYALAPIPLTYAVFWLAMRLPLTRINTRTDFSYGIYIYGTLTLNILATAHLNTAWITYLLLAFAITIAVAALSWYFIEKPAMSLKNSRLRRLNGRIRFVRNGKPQPALVGAGSSTDR